MANTPAPKSPIDITKPAQVEISAQQEHNLVAKQIVGHEQTAPAMPQKDFRGQSQAEKDNALANSGLGFGEGGYGAGSPYAEHPFSYWCEGMGDRDVAAVNGELNLADPADARLYAELQNKLELQKRLALQKQHDLTSLPSMKRT